MGLQPSSQPALSLPVLSFHKGLCIPQSNITLNTETNIFIVFLSPWCMLHFRPISYISSPSNVQWRVQVMKFFTPWFSPSWYHVFTARPTYTVLHCSLFGPYILYLTVHCSIHIYCTSLFTVRSIYTVPHCSLFGPYILYHTVHCSVHIYCTSLFTVRSIYTVPHCSLFDPYILYHTVHCSVHIYCTTLFTTSKEPSNDMGTSEEEKPRPWKSVLFNVILYSCMWTQMGFGRKGKDIWFVSLQQVVVEISYIYIYIVRICAKTCWHETRSASRILHTNQEGGKKDFAKGSN
jgi:hypothetical protein